MMSEDVLVERVAKAMYDRNLPGAWDATLPMALSGPKMVKEYTELAKAAITAYRQHTKDENAALREALAWYADYKTWEKRSYSHSAMRVESFPVLDRDMGERARQALKIGGVE